MKRIIGLLFSLAIGSFVLASCGKADGPGSESDGWKNWEGLKVLMEKAGYDTKGVKVTHSVASDWIYIPDIRSDANAWCGTKNGEPWVGLGHTTIYEEQPETFFDYEFVWKGHKAPAKEVFDIGYGESTEATYSGSSVGFILIDKDFYYLIIADRYESEKGLFSKGGTLLFVENDKVIGQIDNIGEVQSSKANVGYNHDLLFNNACYSKTGEKLYDITDTYLQRIYSAERSLEWLSTPLDHSSFVYLEHRIATSYDMNTASYEFKHAFRVLFAILNSDTGRSMVEFEFPGEDHDRIDYFELKEKKGDVFIYEIGITQFSGNVIKRQIQVDTKEKNAELL